MTAASLTTLSLSSGGGLYGKDGSDIPGICPRQAVGQEDAFQLGLILKSARAYCKRLERAAMDFVCAEEVAEKIDISRDTKQKLVTQLPSYSNIGDGGAADIRSGAANKGLRFDNPKAKAGQDNAYLFDYQFIRKEGKVREKRVLLEENGKKPKSNAKIPETSTFRYSDILLAPVRLLDEKTAEFYRYRLLREDVIDGVKAWALEVAPRLSVPDRYLGAVVWVKQDDGSVLRIDWDTTTFGHYENILARAKAYESEPLVTSRTEFGAEKHGLRFPSLDVTEEAYTGKDGKKFVRATTRIAYKDYKFFVVETETGLAK